MFRARISAVTAGLAGLAIAGTLAACGSNTPTAARPPASSPSASAQAPSSPPTSPAATPPSGAAAPPIIFAVRLGANFSPGSLHVGVGQKFQVIVSPNVKASGLPSSCNATQPTPAAGGMLSVTCTNAGSYLYTAERAGTAVLAAIVRPNCAKVAACPQWISRATLRVTVSS
ncbi:MAG TPA: hypothetical protein VHY31_09545 [Streptosporangiaceae bacterium]|jgi:hypothetical protein|nr:hypothetical protein [Streptosporangiaceae bacterium]